MAGKKTTGDQKFQTHVYLSADCVARLKVIADKETRSVTAQIEHFLKQAIAAYEDRFEPPDDVAVQDGDTGGET